MINSTSESNSEAGAIVLDLDLTSMLVAVITMILVSIVIVTTLILIVWYTKQRKTHQENTSPPSVCTNCQHQLETSHSNHTSSESTLTQDSNDSSVQPTDGHVSVSLETASVELTVNSACCEQPKTALMVKNSKDNLPLQGETVGVLDYDFSPGVSISTSLVHSYASACDDFLHRCTTNLNLCQAGPVHIMKENIHEIEKLGEGQFGQVILAEAINWSLPIRSSSQNDAINLVAVKKLKPEADRGVRRAFKKEIRVMARLNHENIVRLLGVCVEGDMFFAMEYMEKGDLYQYLNNQEWMPQKVTTDRQRNFKDCISLQTLISISFQIASGMQYLASLRFIHRDLASRNCLVGANCTVKIADFGMSRSLYSSHYYKLKGCAILPLRWMATECFYGKFSEKSDMWAFGVTLWEIFSLCRYLPYEQFTNPDLIRDAVRGPHRQLLGRPVRCPSELYRDVLLACWTFEPSQRADFDEVHSILKHFYNHC